MDHERLSDRPRVCSSIGCKQVVEARYLFCRPHYWMLQKELRDALHRSCAPGSGRDSFPCREWLVAAAEAVEFLALLQGHAPANRFRQAVERLDGVAVSVDRPAASEAPGVED